MLHTLNMGCSFITLRQQCNNQRPRCDNAWLHVTWFSGLNNLIVVVSFIGGGNRRKPPTCRKSLTNFIR